MKEWEEFLKDYGFVPWADGGMKGWYRQTAFVKDCLAGEIARYYADDYIVISHAGEKSVRWLREPGRCHDAPVPAAGLPGN